MVDKNTLTLPLAWYQPLNAAVFQTEDDIGANYVTNYVLNQIKWLYELSVCVCVFISFGKCSKGI